MAMTDAKTAALIDKMLAGDRLALARLTTRVENRSGPAAEIMRRGHGRTGRGYILGITGPPGAGKSTVGDRLTALLRAAGVSGGVRGGRPRASGGVSKLLDAFGKQWILIETVGVGQTELDIIKQADTTVVILVPESGGGIQTMKAGLLGVADILVVNKADRDGANPLMGELRFMAHLHRASPQVPKDIEWEIPVL